MSAGINSATVGYAKSMTYEEALKLKDFEYFLATQKPVAVYKHRHVPPETNDKPKFVGVVKIGKRARAIAEGNKRYNKNKGGKNA